MWWYEGPHLRDVMPAQCVCETHFGYNLLSICRESRGPADVWSPRFQQLTVMIALLREMHLFGQ